MTSPVLGSEIVTTHYDTASRASWAGGGFGWGTYVAESRYGSKGQLLMADLGTTYGTAVTYQYDDATNRLELVSLDRERVANANVNLRYSYDDAGNVTSIMDQPTNTALSGPTKQDNQCFNYDGHRRLELAWTALDGNCARTTGQITPNLVGGAAPYWTEYTYDVLGNRVSKIAHATDGSTGKTVTTYTNGGGAAGPHQVTGASVSINGGSTTTGTFAYDAAGRMTTRTQAGAVTTHTWDAESELGKVTTGAYSSSNEYTADGDRLVRTDGSGTTVYLPGGQEIRISGATVSATRYYSFAGQTIAVRTGKGLGGVTSLVNDAHGTPVAAVLNKEQPDLNPVDRFHTDPFGAVRGVSGAGTVPGDQQFLGKTRDAATGYTVLGARYYDETLGRFLTVDPLLDLADPQQWNGYAYAGNNPLTFEDASGLLMQGTTDSSVYNHHTEKETKNTNTSSSSNSIVAEREKARDEARVVTPAIDPPVQKCSGAGKYHHCGDPADPINVTGDDITNWWTGVRQWAASDAGQDLSLTLGTIGLATPLLAWFGGMVGGEYGALAGALIGTAAGLASTGIDCIAEASSPSCVIGAVGSVAGGFGSSLAKSPKHLSLAAEASGKVLTILGLNADVLGGIASWGDWWQRKNFGAG